ncbi:hypothetical protein RB195_010722 [Necator americanus]|uniref:Uncharacterized protein n=1 Tax=Necator americanus TaxID=51031 RepID=A0ABR1D0H3_NECAM
MSFCALRRHLKGRARRATECGHEVNLGETYDESAGSFVALSGFFSFWKCYLSLVSRLTNYAMVVRVASLCDLVFVVVTALLC